MSEQEAKDKWCPYVKIAAGGGQSVEDNRHFWCLATGCMAWNGDRVDGYCNFEIKGN
jgi:hypothetical protein